MKNRVTLSLIVFFVSSMIAYSQQKAIIYGICDNDSIKEIATMESNIFLPRDFNLDKYNQFSKKDNVFNLQTELKSPQVKYLIPPCNLSSYQLVFITPGDSVTFVLKRVKKGCILQFEGKNSAHYNYMACLEQLSPYKSYVYLKKGGSIAEYKQSLFDRLQWKKDFLKQYMLDNKVSDEFVKWAEAQIQNEYVYYLYNPLWLGQVKKENLPNGYFDNDLIIENKLSNFYRLALQAKYIYCYTNNMYNDIEAIYSNITKSFKGQERAFLLSAMIGAYAEKQDQSYSSKLMKIISSSSQYIKDSEYKEYVRKCRDYYAMVNKQFPEDVLRNTYLEAYGEVGKKISLKELLDKYKNNAVYLDFWASRCAPCRDDMSKSQSSKKYLDEKGVKYLYFSVDVNKEAWLNASKKEGATINQYLICDVKNSPLVKYLGLSLIPKYLIMNTEHKIKEANAPRPIPEQFNELQKSVEKCLQKVVSFF